MSLLPLGLLSQGSAGAAGNALTLISTQITSTNVASVVFSSIPSTYKHLQLRMTLKNNDGSSTEDTAFYTFNGDTTAANYDSHYLSGNGSGMNSGYTGTNVGNIKNVATSLYTASAYSAHIMDILDYSNTNKNKTVRLLNGSVNSTYSAYGVSLVSGLWLNTAAISSITINALATYNWVGNCRFSLYGVN